MADVRKARLLGSLVTLVVMLQLLVVQALAASPDLHEHCHGHDHEPGHPCMVTLMLHGGYQAEMPDIAPVDCCPEPPEVPVQLPVAVRIGPSHLAGGVLAHAPPRGP